MTLCLWAAALPAEAQTTETVEVFLDESCDPPDKLEVVLNGSDRPFPVTRNGSSWLGTSPRSFDAATASASLRIGKARTPCQRSTRVKDKAQKNAFLGKFVFACPGETGRVIRIATAPAAPVIPVSYVRFMPRSVVDPSSFDCTESWGLDGSGTIDAVQLGREMLRLQIGRKAPDPEAPGLLVDFAVTRRATKRGGALRRDDILTLLNDQRAATPAGFSSNAYEIDRKRLEAAKLETLTLKVQ